MRVISRKELLEADNVRKCQLCKEIIKGQAIFQDEQEEINKKKGGRLYE